MTFRIGDHCCRPERSTNGLGSQKTTLSIPTACLYVSNKLRFQFWEHCSWSVHTGVAKRSRCSHSSVQTYVNCRAASRKTSNELSVPSDEHGYTVLHSALDQPIAFGQRWRDDYSRLPLRTCSPVLRKYRHQFARCRAIHSSVRVSRRSKGMLPPLSISSLNIRISKLGPSSLRAR